MSTTMWVIMFFGAAITIAALFAAKRNIVPTTIPWLVALVTAITVMYNLKPGPIWGWLVVVLVVVAVIACLWRFAVAVAALAVLAVVAIVSLAALLGQPAHSATTAKPKPTATATATTTTAPAVAKQASDYTIAMPKRGNGRLNKDGVTNRGNVKAFRSQILEQAKRDPLTLFLYYQASPLGTKTPLSNESIIAEGGKIVNGNVYSKKGIRAYKEWAALWTSPTTQISAVDEIKFQGNNSGVSSKNTPTTSNGVTGKDKSGFDIRYTDAMSKTVQEHSALNRCTQPTGNRIPNVPKGPTDNPKVPAPPVHRVVPKVPPIHRIPPPKLAPKVPSEDPAPRGNAPEGGGRNQDPGPGVFIPSEKMERPPATPRRNPAPPVAHAPAPRRTPAPPVGSAPDPAPAPAPEPSAPAPADPVTGTSCAPGISVC